MRPFWPLLFVSISLERTKYQLFIIRRVCLHVFPVLSLFSHVGNYARWMSLLSVKILTQCELWTKGPKTL
jgi:hypothetical protein